MAKNFGEIAFTASVKAEQEKHGSLLQYIRMVHQGPEMNTLGPAERDFIESCDEFYMATVSETGWPYVQYRGGPAGFLKVLDPKTLGFADFRGNRQYISVGNLKHDARVALFLMDYPNRVRFKVLGRAEILEGPESKAAISSLAMQGDQSNIERALRIRIEAFDWNCQQHITRRYTMAQMEQFLSPLQARIKELEKELRKFRGTVD
jgi:predicted pyridoxine 5'-phosphate oxidase superfamily flavin-nucleotide-binding protein